MSSGRQAVELSLAGTGRSVGKCDVSTEAAAQCREHVGEYASARR
ncbi:hypothetical protein OHT76_38115 [Streptomyces sp. NBC_00287]|nr:hypothetical protein [Streptomyces sp. NBC_00287]